MADRYWVGGSGVTWDGTTTTGWSAAAPLEFTGSTSGTALTTVGNPALVVGMTVRAATGTSLGTVVSGSGNSWVLSSSSTQASQTMFAATTGASVPLPTDNVFFTRTSAYSVSISAGTRVCGNLTISAGTVTVGGSGSLSVYGSFSLNTGTVWTNSGTLTFASTFTGNTVTTNGTSLNLVAFNGVGGEWTLGSALTIAASYSITVSAGSVNSGNYNISTPQFISSGSSVKSISFGSSTITIFGALGASAFDFSGATNLTFNAGTSQINLTSGGVGISANNLTFYNVSYTNTAPSASFSIFGSNTFNNVSLAARSTPGLSSLGISDNQTISTLTLNPGTTASCRTMLFSNVVGTTRTLTVGSLASGAADYDFRDIAVVGAAAPLTGTRFGDCKGNSGITFDAAKTVYFRSANGANWATSGSGVWSLTSGGALDATAYPLPQDTAVFPQTPTAYPTSGNTVTINGNLNIGAVDMSVRTTATMTMAGSTFSPNIYGNWTNGTGTTITGTGQFIFRGRNTQQITSAGKAFLCGITLNSPGGSLVLQDNLTSTRNAANAFLLTNGTLNLNGYTLSFTSLNGTFVTDVGTKNITFGGGTISINSSSSFAFNNAAPTDFTTTGSGVITMVGNSTKSFVGGGSTYSCTIRQGGAGALTITGSNTFADITNINTVATSVLFAAGSNNTFTNFSLAGASGFVCTLGSTATSQATLTKSSTWYMGANSTNGGNNTNLVFTAGGSSDYLSVSYINGVVSSGPVLNNTGNFFILF